MRRGWRRGNEEELPCVWQIEVLVFRLDGGWISKVDTHALAHDFFIVEDLLDADCGVVGKEGDDYAPEGLEWCPRMDGCG